MKIFDISTSLEVGMAVWPGDVKFKRQEARGNAAVSRLIMSSHAGTHIDAPRHFLPGKNSVDQIALPKLVGRVKVIAVKSKKMIALKDFRSSDIKAGDRILFKTSNSALYKKKKFTAHFISIAPETARFLAYKKIDLVGIDYLSVDAYEDSDFPVHKILLKAGVVIVEGINLNNVKPGDYNFAALPLKITRGDGAPARVILWK